MQSWLICLARKKQKGTYEIHGIDKLFSLVGVKLHIYGKTVTKPHRKLGHITALIPENKDPIEVAEKIKQTIEIKEANQ